MSRYIDADALIEYLKKIWGKWDEDDWYEAQATDAMKDDIGIVNKQPTVDAVPVVRCEKCRHGIKTHGISDGWVLCSKPYVTDTVGAMMHRADWFCADGERRTE